MIERYILPEMAQVWSEVEKLRHWIRVEREVCDFWSRKKLIPTAEGRALKRRLNSVDLKIQTDSRAFSRAKKRMSEIEAQTKHDVLAFTTWLAEEVGGSESRWIHFGLTSSDVVDTALSLQMQNAGKLFLKETQFLLKVLQRLSKRWKRLPSIGRTHGQFAEPTVFGLKFLGAWAEFSRATLRLRRELEEARVGKLSGAVGANAVLSPQEEATILRRLGLRRETVSTQVLPRDRIAGVINALAIYAGAIERICVELRHLQRSEVGEVREGFSRGQKGSSAMPHKRNPISAENLTGVARMLRSYAQPFLENISLWHERDISHSSVERVLLPDAWLLAHYATARLTKLLEGLEVLPERVRANLEAAGLPALSGQVMLWLVCQGFAREEAYALVQRAAHESLDEGRGSQFLRVLENFPEISSRFRSGEIQERFSLKGILKNVDAIYANARVL